MRILVTARRHAPLALLAVLAVAVALTAGLVFSTQEASAGFPEGVDAGDPVVSETLELPAGEEVTLDFPVEEGTSYYVVVTGEGPDSPAEFTLPAGRTRYVIRNDVGVDQVNENDALDLLKWRATYTGTATVNFSGAQSDVTGAFLIEIFAIPDDHPDGRPGTDVTGGGLFGGFLTSTLTAEGAALDADVDVFSFVPTEVGATYEIDVHVAAADNTLTAPRLTWEVYIGDSETPLLEGDDNDPPAQFEITSGEQHHILIFGPQTNVQGTYELWLLAILEGGKSCETASFVDGGQFVFWSYATVNAADVFNPLKIVWLFDAVAIAWISYVPALGVVNYVVIDGAVLWVVAIGATDIEICA